MKKYTIGEVCKLLGVKSHVLRYWEQEFTLVAPTKSDGGHRIYSEHDVQMLFRVKYLLYEKKFTIDGARKQIWDEFSTADLNMKSKIASIRGDLLSCLSRLSEFKDKTKG